MSSKLIRCAVYTRKSSEEGLDQSFNSIDAQREACEAYVLSQRHEGWVVVPARYDDGGFSGGTLERPAVQRLLADIRAKQVDLVVVYKIDRLTRSLADFAKMVDVFDANAASFVSVTQHFNTTSSMGRLTLNVLLSFAQFEREVTGERIRDKIAASKKKGMWMGGTVPLGYRAQERKLVVEPEEAELVRSIFAVYLQTGSVRELQVQLRASGVMSKRRSGQGGKVATSAEEGTFMRGALYMILKNRVYRGEIRHKELWYPGQHDPIVREEVFEHAQVTLAAGLDRRNRGITSAEPSLLMGWVVDAEGKPLTPTHALKKGKRYRYYVSRPPRNGAIAEDTARVSVPAHDLEQLVVQAVSTWLADAGRLMGDLQLRERQRDEVASILRWAERHGEKLRQGSPVEQQALLVAFMESVQVSAQEVRIALDRDGLLKALGAQARPQTGSGAPDGGRVVLGVVAAMVRARMEMKLVVQEKWARHDEPEMDDHLVLGLARAHAWWRQLQSGEVKSIVEIAQRDKLDDGYVAKLLKAALLAPDIVEGALEGKPMALTSKLILEPRPVVWGEQRSLLMEVGE